MLELRHWRDAAAQFKHSPKDMDMASKSRILRLLGGDKDALRATEKRSAIQRKAQKVREFIKETRADG